MSSKVVISVRNGVPEVTWKDQKIEVYIVDFDAEIVHHNTDTDIIHDHDETDLKREFPCRVREMLEEEDN